MSLFDRTAKRQAKRKQTLQQITPEGWVYLGERNGKPWYKTAPAVAVPKPVAAPPQRSMRYERMDLNNLELQVGITCPACSGTGYRVWGVCYWCNDPTTKGAGKGVLSARDVSLINARRGGAGPICDVKVA